MYIEGDIPNVVTTTNSNGCNNGGFFGNDNGWLGIVLLALIFGWGGNGWGGNGFGGGFGGGGLVAGNNVLASDFATLQRQIDSSRASTETKLDSIANGICSLGYDQLAQMNGINTNIMQNGYETRLGVNGLGTQLQNCCCDLRAGQKDILYGIATQANSLQNSMCMNTRDIIENQNNNARAILDSLTAQRIEDKNTQISELKTALNNATLMASQERQSAYLINELKPCPKPAYITCNPYQSAYGVGLTTNNCGCGCGAIQ